MAGYVHNYINYERRKLKKNKMDAEIKKSIVVM